MTRTAYFDLANGISGDIALAAIADAGRRLAPVEKTIAEAIASLDLGCTVSFVDDVRGGLRCLRAEVVADDRRHSATALREALAHANVANDPRDRALAALDALVEAEATVHGVDPREVHLHELASADTAADLLGAAVALDALGIETVAAAAVPVPNGWIEAEHGALPLPAPVTLELLRGALLRGVDATSELVTPSGAAILVAHGARFGPLPELRLGAVGVGGGKRDTRRPNICRVLIGETSSASNGPRLETSVLLETNIDDQAPEGVAHAVDRLLAAGALDAWITPIVMKRSRPAFLLSALVTVDDEARLTDELFRWTTTLGVRRRELTRTVLDRDEMHVNVRGHDVRVKIGRLRGSVVNVAPEFGDCVSVADATGLATKDVYDQAMSAARAALSE